MKKKIWLLTVRGEFSAAHALRHYHGQCENIHGHNYQVDLTVQGSQLTSDVEIVMDFTELKKLLRQELEFLDHHDINNIPPFDRLNPSSENLAQYLWTRLEPHMQNTAVQMHSVSVSEKHTQTATYREIDAGEESAVVR